MLQGSGGLSLPLRYLHQCDISGIQTTHCLFCASPRLKVLDICRNLQLWKMGANIYTPTVKASHHLPLQLLNMCCTHAWTLSNKVVSDQVARHNMRVIANYLNGDCSHARLHMHVYMTVTFRVRVCCASSSRFETRSFWCCSYATILYSEYSHWWPPMRWICVSLMLDIFSYISQTTTRIPQLWSNDEEHMQIIKDGCSASGSFLAVIASDFNQGQEKTTQLVSPVSRVIGDHQSSIFQRYSDNSKMTAAFWSTFASASWSRYHLCKLDPLHSPGLARWSRYQVHLSIKNGRTTRRK